MNNKVSLITNFCPHYRTKLFELLSEKMNINFYFFSDASSKYWEKNNKIEMGRFKYKRLKGINLGPKLRFNPELFEVIRESDVVIKCINGRIALPFTFFICKLQKKPFILWTELWSHPKTIFHRISFPFTKYIYKHSDAIVVCGYNVHNYLVDGVGIDRNKIFFGWNAVDNSVYNKEVTNEEITSLKNQIGINTEKTVLYVGRLSEEKGLEYLIGAFSKISNKNTTLLIVGNGDQKKQLERLTYDLNVKNVKFLPYLDNKKLYKYYALADVFVLPSVSTREVKEVWGMVINEAMNQGCPIIATDAVGAAVGGLVKNGVNGYIVKEKSASELRIALQNILDNDELREKMSIESKKIIDGWDYNFMAQGFVDSVNFVLDKKNIGK